MSHPMSRRMLPVPPITKAPGMAEETRSVKALRTACMRGADSIPLHRAQHLTDGGNVAHIDLEGQTYTLRITRAGKLILTK